MRLHRPAAHEQARSNFHVVEWMWRPKTGVILTSSCPSGGGNVLSSCTAMSPDPPNAWDWLGCVGIQLVWFCEPIQVGLHSRCAGLRPVLPRADAVRFLLSLT